MKILNKEKREELEALTKAMFYTYFGEDIRYAVSVEPKPKGNKVLVGCYFSNTDLNSVKEIAYNLYKSIETNSTTSFSDN